jgi:hypothetical protein
MKIDINEVDVGDTLLYKEMGEERTFVVTNVNKEKGRVNITEDNGQTYTDVGMSNFYKLIKKKVTNWRKRIENGKI